MTVVVAIKISDGVVAASDSASSLMNGKNVLNVYNNANKIFNLRKGRSIGAMTAGAGSIGSLSISTITKDFRSGLAVRSGAGDWTVSDYANRLFRYMRDKHYDRAHVPGASDNPLLTMWVFGFSPGESLPELWTFAFGPKHALPKEAVVQSQPGIAWGGEPELVQRVILGYGTALPRALGALGVAAPVVQRALEMQKQSEAILCDAMPVQDAIELADFLVRSTIEFSRFKMGAPTVGGPIEIAVTTKHEGFKWVRRKHYFDSELNEPTPTGKSHDQAQVRGPYTLRSRVRPRR